MSEHSTPAEVSAVWREAAARLATAIAWTDDQEVKVALLRRLARQLGHIGYPGFLKLLLIIAESDDARAKRGLAETIAFSLNCQDVPGGQLTSWGASQIWSSQQTLSAEMLPGNAMGVAPRRQFGPIEYLTVWHGQRTQRPYLGEGLYRDALSRLIDLIDHSPEARRLYPVKIESDLAAGVEGAYTRRTRERLSTLAQAWRQGHDPETIAGLAVAAGAPATRP